MRAALLVLVGCMPQLDDAVVTTGRHVTVHAAPAIPVCEDAVAVADRFVEDAAAMLGVEPRPIEYLLFDGDVGCASGKYTGASCTINGTVYSNVWIHFHELAHGIDTTRPPAIFVEGLAEALSTPSELVRNDPLAREHAELDLESTSFRAGSPIDVYRVAGDFVRFLLERFGPERYVAFARSIVSLADLLTIRRVFERSFGESLADVIVAWRASSAADSTLLVPADLVECHDPIAPIANETWSVDDVTPNGCKSGMTPDGTLYLQDARRYGFEISEPGLFVVQAAGTTSARGTLLGCTAGATFDYTTSAATTELTILPLQAGRHAIEMLEGVSAWRVERLGGFGDTCESAPTFTPTGTDWRLEAKARAGSWLRIAQGAVKITTHGTARICTGTCGASQCRRFTDHVELDDAGPLYLVFDGDHVAVVEPTRR